MHQQQLSNFLFLCLCKLRGFYSRSKNNHYGQDNPRDLSVSSPGHIPSPVSSEHPDSKAHETIVVQKNQRKQSYFSMKVISKNG